MLNKEQYKSMARKQAMFTMAEVGKARISIWSALRYIRTNSSFSSVGVGGKLVTGTQPASLSWCWATLWDSVIGERSSNSVVVGYSSGREEIRLLDQITDYVVDYQIKKLLEMTTEVKFTFEVKFKLSSL
jgi:hypothetical protein